MKIDKKLYTKIALALAVCLVVLWSLLGTGTSLAWFSDTDDELRNIFHFAEFEFVVSHLQEDGNYDDIEGDTDIFDDDALYEPGYVQVVYLKIENKGDIDLNYKMAVTVYDYTPAFNIFGQSFNLQDYLECGLVTAESQEELEQKLATRDMAEKAATTPLNTYCDTEPEETFLEAGGTDYAALIVRMPKEVNNVANHLGKEHPEVELGIIAEANQIQE